MEIDRKKILGNSYSCSGNYFIIKAAEIWNHISGIDFERDIGINGVLSDSSFDSSAPELDCLILKGNPKKPITIKCGLGKKIRIVSNSLQRQIQADGATIVKKDDITWEIIPNGDEILLS